MDDVYIILSFAHTACKLVYQNRWSLGMGDVENLINMCCEIWNFRVNYF